MKKAIIICGEGITAAQSMASNLAANGYGPSDILSFSKEASILENAEHIGDVYNTGETALDEAAVCMALGGLTAVKYDASFNAGTNRMAAAAQNCINADFKAGLSLKNGALSYSGPWYFLEMINRGEIYSSGFYNDISFYNSLLFGVAGQVLDFNPATAKKNRGSKRIVFAPSGFFFTAAAAHVCLGMLGKKSCKAVVLEPGKNAVFYAASGEAGCFVTDSAPAACAAAAAGSAAVYLCPEQAKIASGPLSETALTVTGRINPGLIASAVFAAWNQGDTVAMEKSGAITLKKWGAAGNVNPFFLMENDIAGYFGRFRDTKTDIFAAAIKGKDTMSAAFVLYRNLFSINVMRSESAPDGAR
jgi:hypothetical protein